MDFSEFQKVFQNIEIAGDKIVTKNGLTEILEFIKNNYNFDILKDITAVDKKENGIELIYRLFSLSDNENVLISTTVQDEAESVCTIFDSACADEKEIFDLFGVKFVGNNELKRLYMPESWQGHPLKKDYQENDERLRWND